jgi:hypothetical protein
MAKKENVSSELPKNNEALKKYRTSIKEIKSLFAGKTELNDDKARKALRICDDLSWVAAKFEEAGKYNLAREAYKTIAAVSAGSSGFVNSKTDLYENLHETNLHAGHDISRFHGRSS